MTEHMETAGRFIDKVAIVIGAGNGIGSNIAHTFASENARVVIADISRTAGERTCQEIMETGGKATYICVDVADEPQVKQMVATVLDKYSRIDILVNCAGIVVHKLLVDMDLSDWNRQLAVQVTGPFLAAKHVARHMIERGGPGKIVNISSVAALMGRRKCGGHCTAKGGLTQLTKVLAMELAEYEITVNAVAPGLIDVPFQHDEENLSEAYQKSYMEMVPLGRMGQPRDITNSVLFLASNDSDWITGQLFVVDGGLMAGHCSLKDPHDFTSLGGHNDG